MSEELLQRDLISNPPTIGYWKYYNIGQTNINTLKRYKIIPEIDYQPFGRRKPDGILTRNNKVEAVIEYKQPGELNSDDKISSVIADWINVAKLLNSNILILTDRVNNFIWINVLANERILNEDGSPINIDFSFTEQSLKLIDKILTSISEDNSQIIPIQLKDPTPLARQIWQDIWSVSGETPENCLYAFVELFIFKYLSDLNVLTGSHSFNHLLSLYEIDSEDEVMVFYANNIRSKIKELFPQSPTDGTTIINGTIFVNKNGEAVKGYSSIFKRSLERLQVEGNLENIHHDFKSKLFESFLKESISKKNWGQFFTPLKIVRSIVKMADFYEGMSICDPACGVGKFLLEPILQNPDLFFEITNQSIQPKIQLFGFDKGFDKDEQKTIILAKANMLIYLSDYIRNSPQLVNKFSEYFNNTFSLVTDNILGTLAKPENETYDLILTNPPYVTSGSSNIKEEIRKQGLQNYYSISSLGIEGLFLQWVVNALKPGGKAFVIIPSTILNRIPDKYLRRFLIAKCSIDAIISLPKKAFFTTNKKTSLIVLTKKRNENMIQTDPVFCFLVSEIGETMDVYRFDKEENHLVDASELFNQFRNAKNRFNPDVNPRCKLIPFDFFNSNVDSSWIIEEKWNNDERIELGLEDEIPIVSPIEYREMLAEKASTLSDLREAINELSITDQINYRLIDITNDTEFQLIRGKRITKKTINANQGNIPVYSSSKERSHVLGFISEKYLHDKKLRLLEQPSILFNIDGSVGYCFKRNDKKYSFIDVVAALIPRSDNIDLDYLEYELQRALRETGANYDTKLYFGKIRDRKIQVRIPIDENGVFDLNLQKRISSRRNDITQIQKEVEKIFNELTTVIVKE
jgi:type I restriction-modification system DNA methylase subunit